MNVIWNSNLTVYNNVLLEPGHIHSFTYCLCAIMAELSSCDRLYMALLSFWTDAWHTTNRSDAVLIQQHFKFYMMTSFLYFFLPSFFFFLSPPTNILFIVIYSKYALSQNKKEKSGTLNIIFLKT